MVRGRPKIPTINVIKPEPEEAIETDHYSGQRSVLLQHKKESPPYISSYSPLSKQSPSSHVNSPTHFYGDSQSPSVKSEPGCSSFFFPQFPLPLSYSSSPHLSPSPYLSPSSPGLDPVSNYRILIPHGSSYSQPNSDLGQTNPCKQSPSRKREQPQSKQTFKCQKCGKCYN